jgi:hypothetical protein
LITDLITRFYARSGALSINTSMGIQYRCLCLSAGSCIKIMKSKIRPPGFRVFW